MLTWRREAANSSSWVRPPCREGVILYPALWSQVDGAALMKRHRQGWLMEVTDSLDHCIGRLRWTPGAGESGLGTSISASHCWLLGMWRAPGALHAPTRAASQTSVVLRVTPSAQPQFGKDCVLGFSLSVPQKVQPMPIHRKALLVARNFLTESYLSLRLSQAGYGAGVQRPPAAAGCHRSSNAAMPGLRAALRCWFWSAIFPTDFLQS